MGSNFSFIFNSTRCGNYQMLTSVVRVEVSDIRFLISQLTVWGYLGIKNCQMLMYVVRVEVLDIRLNSFCLRTFLGFFRYIYYHSFTRVLAPFTLLNITPLVLILLCFPLLSWVYFEFPPNIWVTIKST